MNTRTTNNNGMSESSEEEKVGTTSPSFSREHTRFPSLDELLDQLETPEDQLEVFKADLGFRHAQLNTHARFDLFRELKEVAEARGQTAEAIASRVRSNLGCNGRNCANAEATKGAVDYIQGMDRAWFETFNYVNQAAEEGAIPGTAIVAKTGKEVVRQVVEEISQVEHFAHVLGEKTTRKQGMSQAQLKMAKIILAAQMIMCIPVTQAGIAQDLLRETLYGFFTRMMSLTASTYASCVTWITLAVNGLLAHLIVGTTNLISRVDQVFLDVLKDKVVVSHAECVAESGAIPCALSRWVSPDENYKFWTGVTRSAKLVEELQVAKVYAVLVTVTLVTLAILVTMLFTGTLKKCCCFVRFKAHQTRRAHQLRRAMSATSVILTSPRNNPEKLAAAVRETFVERIVPHLQPLKLEMAMDGSELFYPKHVSGVMAFVIVEDMVESRFRVVGLAFRHKDFLITAKHVYVRVESESSPVMLAKFIEHPESGASRLDLRNAVELSSFNLHNVVHEEASDYYDVVVCTGLSKYYCKEAISSLQFGSALWGSPVRTVGVTDDILLQSAQGLVRKQEDDLQAVHYTATTHPGWSGGPVLLGKKVVAMHKSARGEINEGLNTSVITMFIQKYEGRSDEATADFKYVRLEKVWRDSDGYEARMDMIRGYEGSTMFMNQRTGRVSWADMEDFEQAGVDFDHDSRFTKSKYGELMYADYKDEANDDVVIEATEDNKGPKALARPSILEFEPDSPLKLMELKENSVTTAYFKGYNTLLQQTLDMEAAKELGYEPNKYKFPELRTVKEARVAVTLSLSKHLHVFEERRKRSHVPTSSQLDIATQIVLKQCLPLRFKMIKHPLSKENLEEIINSTRVDGTKSPGYPYITMGLTTNADVISQGGLVEAIIGQENPWPVNTFAKLEPTKNRKLENKMVRIISGVGLTDQIRTHAYFANLNDVATMNYTKCPIQIGFSPMKVSDAHNFMKSLNPKNKKNVKFLEDDISTWDYNLFQWIVEQVVEIALRLAVPEDGMTELEVENWYIQAKKQALEQFTLTFRTPEGLCVQRTQPCIMTSGSILTILFNSFSMLLLDALAKLRMGLSRSEIEQNFVIKVGGDDKIQSAPKTFDHSAYLKEFELMGVETHSVKSLDTIEGIEFYSWIFTTENGEAKWTPTRFTKHVHSLLATDTKDAADALISHMWNWAHDEQHFNWFVMQYSRLNNELPELFPLKKIPDRRTIISLLRGYEVRPDRDLTHQYKEILARLG